MYALIDTCSWIDLLTENFENEHLLLLEKWVEDGSITLLVPETVREEWVKKGNEQKISFQQSQKTHLYNAAKTLRNQNFGSIIPSLRIDISQITQQVEKIDSLINKGIKIKTTSKIKAICADRFKNKLPPFHNKRDSMADAYLFYSTVEYCKGNKIDKLFFISSNINEFSQKGNKHPLLNNDLKQDGLGIVYYGDIGMFIHELKEILPANYFLPIKSKDDLNLYLPEPNITSLTIEEQILKGLLYYHYELPLKPSFLLAQTFPFRINNLKNTSSHFSNYNLVTNNIEVYDYLEQVCSRKIKTLTEKKILHLLSENHVYHISHNSKNRPVTIVPRGMSKINSQSPIEYYNNLEILKALKCLGNYTENTDNLKHLLVGGYLHYLFFNYKQSAKCFLKAVQISLNKKNEILNVITINNLKFLKQHLDWHDDDDAKFLIEKITELPELELILISTYHDKYLKKIAKFIAEKDFYNDSNFEIMNILKSIQDNYHDQINGGAAMNNNRQSLSFELERYQSFLSDNYILYKNFSNHKIILENAMEGFFICHALNKNQSSRLEYFNEFHLINMILECSTEQIKSRFEKYYLNKINYRPRFSGQQSLVSRMVMTLDDAEKIYAECELHEHSNWGYKNQYSRILDNIIYLSAIINFSKKEIENLSTSVLRLLSKTHLSFRNRIVYVSLFIEKQGKKFDSKIIFEYLEMFIDSANFHDWRLFLAITTAIKKDHFKMLPNKIDSLYSKFIENFFLECPKCKQIHGNDILTYFHKILPDNLQEKLVNLIEEKLDTKFDTSLYYNFSIMGIIDYPRGFDKFINSVPLGDINIIKKRLFLGGESCNTRLSELLNLSFKNHVDTSQERFEKFKGMSDYYDWLLNLPDFDYKKFIPEWVIEYDTIYYREKIAKVKKIKTILKEYLAKKHDVAISEFYIKVY